MAEKTTYHVQSFFTMVLDRQWGDWGRPYDDFESAKYTKWHQQQVWPNQKWRVVERTVTERVIEDE